MVGAIVGGLVSAGGQIAGGIMRSKAIKDAQEKLEAKEKEYKNWYDRRYNEDATARADAQAALTRTEEAIKNRNRAAAGTAAVMGGSQDAVIAAQSANAKALADTASAIALAGEARKDAIERQYMAKQDAIDAQQMQMDINKANAIAQATQGISGVGSMISGGFSGLEKPKKQEGTE